MRIATVFLSFMIAVFDIHASEMDLPPRGEGSIAFEIDVCSFRYRGREGFEEVTLRFPVAQFAFLRQDSGIYLARYRPSLRVLNDAGEVVQQVEAESRLTAESLEATVDTDRMVFDMVQVRLPTGRYRGELTLSDLQADRAGLAVFSLDVPAYDPGKIGMSDLYLSSGFNPQGAGESLEMFRKDGRLILPNPARQYRRGNSLYLYFEVYYLGYQSHRVEMQIEDRYGHRLWRDQRSFPGYRGEVKFAEGIPTHGLLPGTYTLRVQVTAGRDTLVSARKFEVMGETLVPASGFDDRRAKTAQHLLKRFGGSGVEATYTGLGRADRAAFLYGFWMDRNPIVARSYYNPLLGFGVPPDLDGAIITALGRRKEMARHIDPRYAARQVLPDTAMARAALEVLEALLEEDGNDLMGRSAQGYAYLFASNLPYAEQTFNSALNVGGVLPEVYNGVGIVHMGRKRWDEAVVAFDQALALRPNWKTAQANRALARLLGGKQRAEDALKEAIEAYSHHPELLYLLGRVFEREGKVESAEKAYTRQIVVNPMYARARFDLGRIWLKRGQRARATRVWRELMDTRPELRAECLPLLIGVYQLMGQTGEAQKVMAEYLRTVDEHTRGLLQDIRLLATLKETAAYEALPPEQQPDFVRMFWQRRDPTPATPSNERLVEHYRRVLYAMQHFSSGQKPWDKRGEIYIRYGEPAHKSRAGDVRYEMDPNVVRVKERLWMGLTPEAHKEIIARMGRLRTSTRDVQYQGEDAGDLIVSDFESIDYELNPNRTFFGGGADRNDGNYYDDVQDSHRDRDAGMTNIRGFPIFPIDGGSNWEYWIYPDVAGGIEVVFTALDSRGGFDFPDMPQGRVLSTFNQSQWTAKRPDRVMARAVRQQSEIYRSVTDDLAFHFDAIDFRGESPRSRLEVYYGVPLGALIDSGRTEGHIERGIALFDSTWTPVFRKVAGLPFAVSDDAEVGSGTLLIDELALNVPPGKYFLGVEVHDRTRNMMGAYTREVEVEAYQGGELGLSDIEMAGSVVEDAAAKVKGGHKVVPMPSKTYVPGQPVTIYYEVYGLTFDELGQTRYQMDYKISPRKGKPLIVTILRAVGTLLGIEEEKEVTISYEQVGTRETEYNYLEIDVSGSEAGHYEMEVTVTDLNTGMKVNKEVMFFIGK